MEVCHSRSKQASNLSSENFDMYMLVFVVRFVAKKPGAFCLSSTKKQRNSYILVVIRAKNVHFCLLMLLYVYAYCYSLRFAWE